MLSQLVSMFDEDAPGLLAEIRDAADAGDVSRLTRAAHTLKGSCGLLAAHAAQEAARRIEEFAREGDLDHAAAALTSLDEQIARVMPELRRIRTGSGVSSCES